MNTRDGSISAIGGPHDSRAAALDAGRQLARDERAEHVSHRTDGSIDEITVLGG